MLSLEVGRYLPRLKKEWKRNSDGSISAQIYTSDGIVELFTFPGDERCRAFTHLTMYLSPYVYRCFHERWLRRVARQFAVQCEQMARADR